MKRWFVIMLAAMLLTACQKPQKETEPATEQTSTEAETTEEETEETEPATEESTEEEVPASTEADEVIIDSYYQEVNTTWQDTYLALLYAVYVQPDTGVTGSPNFALMKFPGEEIPMMICGYTNGANGYGNYRLYGFEDGRLYELKHFQGLPTIDLANNKIAIDEGAGNKHYIYREQNLVQVGTGDYLKVIPLTMLHADTITIDNLESYLLVN